MAAKDENLTVEKRAWLLAGKLAQCCRSLVGGKDINGFSVPAANLNEVSGLAEELRGLLDDYDSAILEIAEAGNKRRKSTK